MPVIGLALARLAGLGAALGRFWNANALVAVVVAALVAGGLGLVAALRHEAAQTAARARDAHWARELAEARARAALERIEQDREARRREDEVRADAARVLEEQAGMIADLEAELGRLKAKGGDPVVFPRSLARELRR
jgi:hypothetical protein